MFTEEEQNGLDIDWFFINKDKIGFVASGGGRLPQSVALLEKHEILVSYFRNLPNRTEISINPKLAEILVHPINDRYLSDFVHMAQKGLYSFDKTHVNDFLKFDYHLVAKPINHLPIDELPLEILSLLSTTVFPGDLESGTISSLEIT